jgi:hypothetical protein
VTTSSLKLPASKLVGGTPARPVGHELIAAGMLILAGRGRGVPLDYDELERWTRVGSNDKRRPGAGSDKPFELWPIPIARSGTEAKRVAARSGAALLGGPASLFR